jgi:hypothetical protein
VVSRLEALVEVLHPDGAAIEPGDVLVVPGRSADAGRVAARLAPDGIAWIGVPPHARRSAGRELRSAGLIVAGCWLAWPPRSPRSLLPLHGAAQDGALSGGLLEEALVRTSLRLGAMAPGLGLVAQHRGARRPLSWLEAARAAGPSAISAGWHDPRDGLVVHCHGAVVKTTRPDARRDPLGEAAALRTLAAPARACGVETPDVLFAGAVGRRVALAETLLPGRRAAALVARDAHRLPGLLRRLSEWLACWHSATVRARPFTAHDAERFLLEPARALGPGWAAQLAGLERLAARLEGRDVPFAAAHNDLTTWNVLADDDRLAVVDWEVATAEAPPLVDLDYLIVDAVAVARRVSRPAAFARCAADGADGRLARDLRGEAYRRAGMDEEVIELARQACWLGHARNEAERAPAGAPRPFLAIAHALAA